MKIKMWKNILYGTFIYSFSCCFAIYYSIYADFSQMFMGWIYVLKKHGTSAAPKLFTQMILSPTLCCGSSSWLKQIPKQLRLHVDFLVLLLFFFFLLSIQFMDHLLCCAIYLKKKNFCDVKIECRCFSLMLRDASELLSMSSALVFVPECQTWIVEYFISRVHVATGGLKTSKLCRQRHKKTPCCAVRWMVLMIKIGSSVLKFRRKMASFIRLDDDNERQRHYAKNRGPSFFFLLWSADEKCRHLSRLDDEKEKQTGRQKKLRGRNSARCSQTFAGPLRRRDLIPRVLTRCDRRSGGPTNNCGSSGKQEAGSRKSAAPWNSEGRTANVVGVA